jgi:Fe2+ transport system protein FeoA
MTAPFVTLTTTTGPTSEPVPLTSLPNGAYAEVACRNLDENDSELLCAMGLKNKCPLRVCRSGSMCIIKMDHGRLAMSPAVAARIMVRPMSPTAPA